ncbi:hypothetical protein Ancab_016491 [Ancistrocladus abbreviatus]
MAAHFDQWERDPFFFAADEVQESADRMESTYRTWIHAMKDTSGNWNADELRRDLRAALGTTKWQLEEFERAARSSYMNNIAADEAKERHRQFIIAMEDKIASVENSLQESAESEGRTPRSPWVHLDEGERDELALFLSVPGISADKLDVRIVSVDERPSVRQKMDGEPGASSSKNPFHQSEQCLREGKGGKLSGHRRTASASADIGSWKIMVAEDGFSQTSSNGQVEMITPRRVPSFSGLMDKMESLSKLKLPKNGFRKWKAADRQQDDDDVAFLRSQQLSKSATACCERTKSCLDGCDDYYDKQLHGWYGAVQRLLQRSQYQVQYSRPVQLAFWIVLLLLSIGEFIVTMTLMFIISFHHLHSLATTVLCAS